MFTRGPAGNGSPPRHEVHIRLGVCGALEISRLQCKVDSAQNSSTSMRLQRSWYGGCAAGSGTDDGAVVAGT
jgi:hypothetical protein